METYKIKSISELNEIILNLKSENKKIVFTNGCFDILHKGHLYYLKESKKLGDILVVAINSDKSVKKLKGENRPVNNQENRSDLLSLLKCVDFIIIFDEDTPYDLIKMLNPDIITKGGDYKKEEVVGSEFIRVEIIPYINGFSTTEILNKL